MGFDLFKQLFGTKRGASIEGSPSIAVVKALAQPLVDAAVESEKLKLVGLVNAEIEKASSAIPADTLSTLKAAVSAPILNFTVKL